jgi:hypothetical protein
MWHLSFVAPSHTLWESRLLPKSIPLLVRAVFGSLLAISDPFFIFSLFWLVFPHTWFHFPITGHVFNPLFPPCLCVWLFIVKVGTFFWLGFSGCCFLPCFVATVIVWTLVFVYFVIFSLVKCVVHSSLLSCGWLHAPATPTAWQWGCTLSEAMLG